MENMDGVRFLNFRRKTSSGVPFCFTIEAGDGTAGCIAKEIFSFVTAVVPEQCAREWMIQSGAMEPSEFLQAVSDMEDVRLRARLLALELAAMNAKCNLLDGQTELTVFLTLAATFGQAGFLVGYQVSSSEHPFCLIRYLQESQRLFHITDIGIDGAAVNTQVACCLLY